uniref:Glycine-rich cell wall structural protein 1.8-like n=1 Tax=Elaeis guineensis var. tenera TaxID=51953 RepID=A0A6I9QJY9_ELAGV|nr:glycine-rich cell wall structural protein 1.8-like [Elaeis guineensis]
MGTGPWEGYVGLGMHGRVGRAGAARSGPRGWGRWKALLVGATWSGRWGRSPRGWGRGDGAAEGVTGLGHKVGPTRSGPWAWGCGVGTGPRVKAAGRQHRSRPHGQANGVEADEVGAACWGQQGRGRKVKPTRSRRSRAWPKHGFGAVGCQSIGRGNRREGGGGEEGNHRGGIDGGQP